ncbi:MAG: futalosine hydrolase, partial [Gammaproteobacteria bacterium]|nr:futalosine hydrolase [Gammaproteobacteria bacterium]
MIALLAAVPEETKLIRESLEDVQESKTAGLSLTTGAINGQQVCLTHSGVGKAAAAAATVSLLLSCKPKALILFGCGGAYPNSGMQIGDLAIADSELFGDEGVATLNGFQDLAAMGLAMREENAPLFNRWPTDSKLFQWATTEFPIMNQGAFVTISTCTGTTEKALELEKRTGGICENMEGAAVALACRQLAIPMLEIRGISNMV